MAWKLDKKGYSIGDLPTLAIMLGVGIIVLSIGAQIVGEVKGTQTANTAEYNVSDKGLEGMQKVGDWLPTIGLVVGAVIIIGVLFMFYRVRR